MAEYLPTYNYANIFSFPREVRIIELLILIVLYLKLLGKSVSKEISKINIYLIVFTIISLLSLFFNGTFSLSGVQEIYIRIVPFIFFVIAVKIGVSERDLKRAISIFSFVLILSTVFAIFYQIPFFGFHEDSITGFFSDAHVFGTILGIISIVCFIDYINYGYRFSAIFSFTILLFTSYPKNEKIVALNVLAIITLLLFHILSQLSSLKKYLVISTLFISLLFFYPYAENYLLGPDSNSRYISLVEFGIESFGPIIAWPMAWDAISESIKSSLFGVGAGEYGWITAGRNVAMGAGSKHSKVFDLEFAPDNINNSGFLFRTNTWSSLLAEFGLIGFINFIIIQNLIVIGVSKYKTQSRFEKNIKATFYIILMLIIFQGFFTPYTNWSESVLMFPMMYIAAYFFSFNKKNSFMSSTR